MPNPSQTSGGAVARDALRHSFHGVQNLVGPHLNQSIPNGAWTPVDWFTPFAFVTGRSLSFNNVNEVGLSVPGVYTIDISLRWQTASAAGIRGVTLLIDGTPMQRYDSYRNPAPLAGVHYQSYSRCHYFPEPAVFEVLVYQSAGPAVTLGTSGTILEVNLADEAPAS